MPAAVPVAVANDAGVDEGASAHERDGVVVVVAEVVVPCARKDPSLPSLERPRQLLTHPV